MLFILKSKPKLVYTNYRFAKKKNDKLNRNKKVLNILSKHEKQKRTEEIKKEQEILQIWEWKLKNEVLL